MAEEGEHGRLIERHPILDTVAQVRREQRGVVGEPAHHLRVGEAAAVLQRLRQVPMEEVDQRLDARAKQGVDEALVEVEAALVDGAGPHGQDARPADAEAVCARAQVGHQSDVLWVAVVVVAGDVAGAAIGDGARLAGEGVPDRRSSAVLGRCSLDLVGGGGEAPGEVGREGLASRAGSVSKLGDGRIRGWYALHEKERASSAEGDDDGLQRTEADPVAVERRCNVSPEAREDAFGLTREAAQLDRPLRRCRGQGDEHPLVTGRTEPGEDVVGSAHVPA